MDKTFDSNTDKQHIKAVKRMCTRNKRDASLQTKQEILAIAFEIYFRFVFEMVENQTQKSQNPVKTWQRNPSRCKPRFPSMLYIIGIHNRYM